MRLEKLNNSDFLYTYTKSNQLMPKMDRAENLVTISQEGLGSFIQSVSNFFLEKVKGIKQVFSFNAKEVSLVEKDLLKLAKPVEKIANLDETAQAAIKKIIIPWIPGIDQDFYQLVTGLVPHLDNIQKNGASILEEIDTYLAKIAGDEEYRISKMPNKELVKSLKKFEENDTKYLESIINGKQLSDAIELGIALPNVKTITTIHSSLQSVTNIKNLSTLEGLLTKINKLTDRADGIYNMLKEDKTAMSKVKIDELVEVLKVASKIVINVSSLIRLYDASIKVEKAMIEKLSKVI